MVLLSKPLNTISEEVKADSWESTLLVLLGVLSVLLVVLVVVLIYALRTRRKALRASQQISALSYLKETYVAHYMDQCCEYIEKLEHYRKSLRRVVTGGKIDDIKKLADQLTEFDEEIVSFYRNFDQTILRIFPSFIEEFNSFLLPDEQIIPKSAGRLNTELRIYALIRLGINDSAKIAKFLRLSTTTIYNYRTRVRNKAKGNRDTFEQDIMDVGRI